MDEKELENEADHDVTEEYISSVQEALGNVIPEDFSSVTAPIKVDAADGERIAMIITGTAAGGKLTSVYGAKLDLSEPEEEKPGKLKKLFKGDTADEEA